MPVHTFKVGPLHCLLSVGTVKWHDGDACVMETFLTVIALVFLQASGRAHCGRRSQSTAALCPAPRSRCASSSQEDGHCNPALEVVAVHPCNHKLHLASAS